jgi:hypothetical protein
MYSEFNEQYIRQYTSGTTWSSSGFARQYKLSACRGWNVIPQAVFMNFMFEFPCVIRLYYIKDQQNATVAICLLVTARLLYMFQTLSASIIYTS